ncbi:ABC transporter ATP-binding protein [Novosphingobium sp. B 225]|uniref:ABC transporter ATP-binding protein n=1 Tax=Novosphingobium sp. B 225 TaxID=1961849 RepID=UPI001595E8EE|nr:ABC transporter ATP-binding protein [Novosphingobium sp. B 225]
MTAPVMTPLAAARLIYRQLGARRQRQLLLTLVLMVAGALTETLTVGAVLPFLAIVAPGAGSGRYAWLVGPVEQLGALLGVAPVAAAAGLLIAIAVVAAVIRLVLLWVSQHYVFAVAHDLSLGVYGRVLHRPYARHVMHNSSETLAAMEKVQFVLGNVLLPAMAGLTALVVALFILSALMAIDASTSLIAAACFGVLYALVSRFTRKRLYANSDVISGALKQRVQVLQEGLGGIRDVLLDRSQPVFLAKFGAVDDAYRQAQAANQFIAAAPRHVVEAAGVVLIAVIAVYVSGRPGGMAGALPMLGALAVGAQRLLPQIQQAYFSWSQIHGHRAALIDVALLMEEPFPDVPALPPVTPGGGGSIAFRQVSFAYPGHRAAALKQIDLTIEPGARIGLVGRSGSGKSTFVDLLMGLLDPGEGELQIDGQRLDEAGKAAWQAQVAHVPQAIFLADGSIAANIAFGRASGEIDMERVREAARLAELDEFIAALPEGYDTTVGERGVRLSGGQRQRIGIARALYKQASVLVLDEATSALDDATEAAVMQSVSRLPRALTLVIVAHRLTTLHLCDRIVRLDGGRIAGTGTYAELIGTAQDRA